MLSGTTEDPSAPTPRPQVVKQPVVLLGNSAGGLAALQTSVTRPDIVQGLLLLDCSMRHMHVRNQPALLHPLIAAYQWLLHDTPVGHWVYQDLVTRPNAVFELLKR
jgi:pimeloyl-ACP methyl ester carboxylesterase